MKNGSKRCLFQGLNSIQEVGPCPFHFLEVADHFLKVGNHFLKFASRFLEAANVSPKALVRAIVRYYPSDNGASLEK